MPRIESGPVNLSSMAIEPVASGAQTFEPNPRKHGTIPEVSSKNKFSDVLPMDNIPSDSIHRANVPDENLSGCNAASVSTADVAGLEAPVNDMLSKDVPTSIVAGSDINVPYENVTEGNAHGGNASGDAVPCEINNVPLDPVDQPADQGPVLPSTTAAENISTVSSDVDSVLTKPSSTNAGDGPHTDQQQSKSQLKPAEQTDVISQSSSSKSSNLAHDAVLGSLNNLEGNQSFSAAGCDQQINGQRSMHESVDS